MKVTPQEHVGATREGDPAHDAERAHGKRDDERGRALVMTFEAAMRRVPEEMPQNQRGYDIKSHDPIAKRERRIEVKGLSQRWIDDATVCMTGPQFNDGRLADDSNIDYWLYIVDGLATDAPRVLPIPKAAARVERFYFQAMDWEGEVIDATMIDTSGNPKPIASAPLDPDAVVDLGEDIPEGEPA